jgi:Barstar (barnase inhibitor)
MPIVRIDASQLRDWDAFHTIFASAFGFPDFYGRNMNAWIDCMTDLGHPENGMTTVHGSETDPVVVNLTNTDRAPKEILDALVDCAASVNRRSIDAGEPVVLILAFDEARR